MAEMDQNIGANDIPGAAAAATDVEDETEGISLLDADNDVITDGDDDDDDDAVEVIGEDPDDYYNDDAEITTAPPAHGILIISTV